MLSKKPLILTLVIAFSVHCSNGRAQENGLPLRFALAVGKVLFPVRDGLPDEQESETIEWWELKVHSRAASDNGSDSEDSSTSDESNDNRLNEDEDEANAESDVQHITTTLNPFRVSNEISQYCPATALKNIKQEPVSDSAIVTNGGSDESIDNRSNKDESDVQYETTTLNPFRASNEISQYCPATALKNIKQEPVSDSAIVTNGGSDESIDNRSNKDESDVQYETTTLNPFRASNEISQYCPATALKNIKQEPVSDSEILTDSEVDVTKVDAAKHQCDHEGCDYRTKRLDNLKRHKQIHLPADQRPKRPKRPKPKVHQCDHESCDYNTYHMGHLKQHKQTHLPANQRLRVHKCDHEGCNYSVGYSAHLKRHKQIHLPADQRPKVHKCDYEGCNFSTSHSGNLKMHEQTHLPANQRLRMHQCDHEGCNYSTDRASNLKKHKQTHLPADQRSKRKACDQPSSNKKRKKADKE
ncbi:hypothetical protein [Endozoicomonas sp. 4G]|uniref:hypothetical protein n=1 Tax=Endozoicomonas sp. 4G TaxID=2872754 RepID=UPI002078E2A9|nr:hypothetical protein [Endozoicomonas sp. 4G]